MAYDLHLHSKCSRHVRNVAPSPTQIVLYAKKSGLEGLALTDHDSRAGIMEAQAAAGRIGIGFIPGIEMSFGCDITKEDVKLFGHDIAEDFYVEGEILGYFINPDYNELRQIEKDGEDSRRIRDSGLRKALNIPREELVDDYTRDDLADRVVEDGLAENRSDAYTKILKPAGKSIVERKKTPLKDVVRIIKDAGGVPIVAHVGMIIRDYWLWPPDAFGYPDEDLRKGLPEYDSDRDFEKTLLPILLESGIKGFEVYPYALVGKGVSQIEMIFFNFYAEKLNQEHNLINRIRGSDCHFQPNINTQIGCWQTDISIIKMLKEEHLKITKAL